MTFKFKLRRYISDRYQLWGRERGTKYIYYLTCTGEWEHAPAPHSAHCHSYLKLYFEVIFQILLRFASVFLYYSNSSPIYIYLFVLFYSIHLFCICSIPLSQLTKVHNTLVLLYFPDNNNILWIDNIARKHFCLFHSQNLLYPKLNCQITFNIIDTLQNLTNIGYTHALQGSIVSLQTMQLLPSVIQSHVIMSKSNRRWYFSDCQDLRSHPCWAENKNFL